MSTQAISKVTWQVHFFYFSCHGVAFSHQWSLSCLGSFLLFNSLLPPANVFSSLESCVYFLPILVLNMEDQKWEASLTNPDENATDNPATRVEACICMYKTLWWINYELIICYLPWKILNQSSSWIQSWLDLTITLRGVKIGRLTSNLLHYVPIFVLSNVLLLVSEIRSRP